ncbi:hypothetical protein [Algoriphagus winogradskyi]|uniref:Uncharacterized protein n=1 Tax=Algoriphagus winogradskyi TaxID=237017 RepID=A0ABY1NXC8_9BACT|nr:hypothetical protein [Algoriphagus winogradskyi]SMP20975.1 hypothetical protein SAMN06265367_103209 [Algoriphagus winogradskyi]
MIIQTTSANFMIEKSEKKDGCVSIRSNSQDELNRFFGSLEIIVTEDLYYAYEVLSCKQEFANAMILMVKEIDYSEFAEFSLQTA